MNRKMISLLLALILASGTLASCSNPKDPAETAGTESENATDTTRGGGCGLERRRLERHGADR